MSTDKFVSALDKDQLLYAKRKIEERLKDYEESKKLKFAVVSTSFVNLGWCDIRDMEGWEKLKKIYLKESEDRWKYAVGWCDGDFKRRDFIEELPTVNFVEVSEIEYDDWIKDSVNPKFKAQI